jgi:hypothetical protein
MMAEIFIYIAVITCYFFCKKDDIPMWLYFKSFS